MTFRDGVSIVYRRKLVAIGFFVCVVASGFVVLTIVPPVYRATAQVMLHLGQEDVFMPTLASSSSEVRTPLSVGGLEQRTNSEIRIVESEALAAQLMSRFGAARLFPGINVQYSWFTPKGLIQRVVAAYRQIDAYFYPESADQSVEERALRRLRKNLGAVAVKDSTVIEVTMRSSVPAVAAESVNELVRLYLAERPDVYKHEDHQFFASQLIKLSATLDVADQQLRKFRTEHNVIDVKQQSRRSWTAASAGG